MYNYRIRKVSSPTPNPTPSPTYPFEGPVIIVDNLVDSPAYPLNCTTFGRTGRCNFRSATWACQAIDGVCNILLPPDESIFLKQDDSYGSTFNPDLSVDVGIVYYNSVTYSKGYVSSYCCFTCDFSGVHASCSIIYLSESNNKPPQIRHLFS